MNNTIINKDLLIKIISFLKKSNSLKYLDLNIFESIDEYKEISDANFNDYYLEYVKNLPKLNFETVVKISREVFQLCDKEKDFDEILERLINSHSIDNGSLNKEDDNCITKASESRILLSGTYYDVILLCHEIGHKLRCNNFKNQSDIMDSFFFETPSIILEFMANDYLRDNYSVDLGADKLRKKHISSIQRVDGIENSIFKSIQNLLKKRKLNPANLYIEFVRNKDMLEHFYSQSLSIENCVEEAMSSYSYDIGYIFGNYVRNYNNKSEIINKILNYKDNGICTQLTIDNEIIKDELIGQKYTR